MKKILCVFLCVLISFSVLSIGASADSECAHSYSGTVSAPNCVEDGYTLYVCTKCGDMYKSNFVPAKGHKYSDWTVEKDATCTEEGLRQQICTVCGAAKTETLSAGHLDKNKDGKCDRCGLKLDNKVIIAPFDWLVALFKSIVQWFREIFA